MNTPLDTRKIRKLTVTTSTGVTFTRRTPRDYKYAVVSAPGSYQVSNSEISVKSWTERVASGSWGDRTQAQLDEYLAQAQQHLADCIEANKTGRHTFITWHQRLDLAEREASKRAADSYFSNVEIVAV